MQEGLKDVIKSKQQVFPTLKAILKRASIVYQERYQTLDILRVKNLDIATDFPSISCAHFGVEFMLWWLIRIANI